jgi:hypothetical protein
MCAVTPPVTVRQLFFLPGWNESLAKIIYITKQVVNFIKASF